MRVMANLLPELPADDQGAKPESVPFPLRTRLGQRVTAITLPLLAAVASLVATWKCWINPLVDSGRELDVPSRLAQGERLYRDVTYYYGPVGPWINAAALRFFGARWLVLEMVCAATALCVFVLLFRITRRAGSMGSAIAATTLAAAICMGAPNGGAFIFPYSSSALIALAGALLAIDMSAARGRWPVLFGALGLAVSLASRLEIGGAAVVVLLVAALCTRQRQRMGQELTRLLASVILASIAYAAAFRGIAWRELVTDGPLTPFLAMPEEWRRLYMETAGLSEPVHSVAFFVVAATVDLLLLLIAARFALPSPAHPRRRVLYPVVAGLVLTAYGLSRWSRPEGNLPPLVAILPVLALVAALGTGLELLRGPLAEPERSRFLLFSFSGLVALRVLLGLSVGPRMSCYTPIALPGLLATAAILALDQMAWHLPAPFVFRRRIVAMFALFGLAFLYRMTRFDHGSRIAEVNTPSGSLRLPVKEARAIELALADLARRARRGDTLTAFPESGFFNFVLGLRSPLRQDLFLPGVAACQLDVTTQRIERSGPRYILLCNRPTPEYGKPSFGRDYARQLWSEVRERYFLASAFGTAPPSAPVGAPDFFVRLYVRAPVAYAQARPPTGDRTPSRQTAWVGNGAADFLQASAPVVLNLHPRGARLEADTTRPGQHVMSSR
jgi:hypothetical protein